MASTTAAVTTGGVTLTAAIAGILLIGGTHTAKPTPIVTPTADSMPTPGYVSQVFRWIQSPDATGYRLYIDGVMSGQVPGTWTGATMSISCGQQHRFNVQPFNNKGVAPFAPPVLITVPCPTLTP